MLINYDYTDEVLKYSKHMDESERQAYVNRVYKFIMDLKPGQKVEIDRIVKKENRDLFIAVTKQFVLESNHHSFEFTSDYGCFIKASVALKSS